MEYVKLTDICRPKQWKTIAGKDLLEEGYPVYGANGKIGYWSDYNHEAETVTIACRGTCGTINIVPAKSYINGNAMSLDNLSDSINLRFLYYFLKGYDFKEIITGTTIPQITIEGLRKVRVPCLSLNYQEKLVQIFDKVQNLIDCRLAELQMLDDLIKARFVEMFGDPESGTCSYPIERLGDLAVKISDGVHAKPVYTDSGKPFLSVVNINKGIVDFTDCKYVSEEAYQKMIKSTHPQKGDVLYTKVGATYGIPAYVDTDREFCLYVSVCLIKPIHEKINSRFLALQMAMPSIKHQADARIKGIGVPDLHLNQISEFLVITPPREQQDIFVEFVEQVDKSKFAVQKALDEAQMLFDSLMQSYFG